LDRLFPDTISGDAYAHRDARSSSPLLLSQSDIAPLLTHADYVEAVEFGFRALARHAAAAPAPLHVAAAAGGFHAKAALLQAADEYVAVKVNSNFPGNPASFGLPTIQGAVLLFDAGDGRLLAVMDSVEITLRRTAAASALAARHLARRDAATIALCGCGEQARAQLEALAAELPLRRGFAWDIDAAAARRFAMEMAPRVGFPIVPCADMRAAVIDSDAVVTTTPARVPFLGLGDVRAGSFIAAVGADNPEKSELRPELMARARVFVDVREQCLAMGDLHHAVAAGAMTADDVEADLAELVTGRRTGRLREDDITIFDSTGTAIEDVAAAVSIFERARSAGAGTPIILSRRITEQENRQ
jgi:ornithine cyclodeaminase/alanine dehydrogenase-like protein (mu-crystallin family)